MLLAQKSIKEIELWLDSLENRSKLTKSLLMQLSPLTKLYSYGEVQFVKVLL